GSEREVEGGKAGGGGGERVLGGWRGWSQYCRASLAAFSVASDPPDTNHTRFRSPGANLATASARASRGSLVNRCIGTNATFFACAAIASAISRTPCPMDVTADDPPEPSM